MLSQGAAHRVDDDPDAAPHVDDSDEDDVDDDDQAWLDPCDAQ